MIPFDVRQTRRISGLKEHSSVFSGCLGSSGSAESNFKASFGIETTFCCCLLYKFDGFEANEAIKREKYLRYGMFKGSATSTLFTFVRIRIGY